MTPAAVTAYPEPDEAHQRALSESYQKALLLKQSRDKQNQIDEGEVEDEKGSYQLESEDEDGEGFSAATDAALLKTLALLQKKDPAIYDPSAPIFDDAEKTASSSSKAFLASNAADGDEDQLASTSAIIKGKSYRKFMRQEVGELKDLLWIREQTRVSPDVDKGSSGKGKGKSVDTSAQDFLESYILNRGWVDKKNNTETEPKLDVPHIDDEFEELEEDFEATYNFRYEQPDNTKIPREDRGEETVLSRKKSKRKEARERKKKRLDEDRRRAAEQTFEAEDGPDQEHMHDQFVKALEMDGFNAKSVKAALANIDLEDVDLETLDKHMASLYENDDFYQENEWKPSWVDNLSDEDMDLKEESEKDADAMASDEGSNEEHDAEEWDGTEKMRKRAAQGYLDEITRLPAGFDKASRFKYTTIPKEKFSLTATQILMATEDEMNELDGIGAT
ncbi:hypothetical protein FRB99_003990, partial [Tulasnella sp. 403]